ncbi:MAG: hypothetical protein ACFHU9_14385 [Fluviicola sp.]
MKKKLLIPMFVAFGLLSASCGGAESNESLKKSEDKREQIEQNLQPEETVEAEEVIKWYEGEEPTDLEKLQLLASFHSGERKFDFYAVFTEPFWTFYFFGNEVLFNAADFDVPEVLPIEYPFSDKMDEQALSFMRNGEFWQFKVVRKAGSDGMSELEYPYTVKLDMLEGGGATEFVKE